MELQLNLGAGVMLVRDEFAALAESFRSEMMDTGELLYLAAVLGAVKWSADRFVVEIGAYHGRTTVFIAEVLERLGGQCPVVSIDPFERAVPDALNPQGSYASYMSSILGCGYGHRCMPLVAFSQDAHTVLASQIAILVIDGAHHYPAISADLALYLPKVCPGGYVFVDDYGEAYPDVVRAVDEYFAVHEDFVLLHKQHFVIARRRCTE